MELFLEKLFGKLFRKLLSPVVSSKRISQSGFERMVIKLEKDYGPESIKFINSSKLIDALAFLPRDASPKVIVSGGSDYDFSESDLEFISGFTKTVFFLQNLNYEESPNIKLLPIGVEDLSWARNGMPWNFRKAHRTRLKSNEYLAGPFSMTHSDRADCLNSASSESEITVIRQKIPSWRYANLASGYQYILCPRGNGLDTHRFWESLYRGCTPVVLSTPWAKTLSRYDIPLVLLTSWSNIKAVKQPLKPLPKQDLQYLNPQWWNARFLESISRP